MMVSNNMLVNTRRLAYLMYLQILTTCVTAVHQQLHIICDEVISLIRLLFYTHGINSQMRISLNVMDALKC